MSSKSSLRPLRQRLNTRLERRQRACEKEILEQEDCLPNPDISSVASLLHAQGFHILFSSCSAHFPEPIMMKKRVTLNLLFEI